MPKLIKAIWAGVVFLSTHPAVRAVAWEWVVWTWKEGKKIIEKIKANKKPEKLTRDGVEKRSSTKG